jgi:UDP-2,3-diacylglucosamine pyrophosphatase LpxH
LNVKTFLTFLEWLCGSKAHAKTLILLGDIFDEWIFGFDITPAETVEIEKKFSSNTAEVMTALTSCAASGIRIVYIQGNHDGYILRKIPSLVKWSVGERFEENGVLFVHGHQFDAFNTTRFIPSTKETGYGLFPLGYYIARAARKNGGKGGLVTKLLKNLDGLVGMTVDSILDKDRHDDIIRGIFSHLGYAPSAKLVIDASTKVTTTVGQIIETYAGVLKSASEVIGPYHEMLMASSGNLTPIVKRFCGAYNTVVAGHIHTASYRRLKRGQKEHPLDFYTTGSWKKDGSITGLKLGANAEYWKISPTGYEVVEKIKTHYPTRNWIRIYGLQSEGKLRTAIESIKDFERIFVERVPVSEILVFCPTCKKCTPLQMKVEKEYIATVKCATCQTVYAVGTEEKTIKAALLSAAKEFKNAILNRLEERSIASFFDSMGKQCGVCLKCLTNNV